MKSAALALLASATAWAEPASYVIDPTHSFASFEYSHFGTSTGRGRWDRKEGTVQFDRAARTGRVEIQIEMASINTGVPALDQLLKGPEFFDSMNHPHAQFISDRFVFDGQQLKAVEGQLTVKGRSHPVTLKASLFGCYTNPIFKREVCGGDFEAQVQPSWWGLTAYIPQVAADRVRLLVQVEAIRQ